MIVPHAHYCTGCDRELECTDYTGNLGIFNLNGVNYCPACVLPLAGLHYPGYSIYCRSCRETARLGVLAEGRNSRVRWMHYFTRNGLVGVWLTEPGRYIVSCGGDDLPAEITLGQFWLAQPEVPQREPGEIQCACNVCSRFY